MSITRFTTVLAALATAIALTSTAHAQLFKPFAFPPLESDFQFFAPGEIDTYGGGPKHKTGWFATYDRLTSRLKAKQENQSWQRWFDTYSQKLDLLLHT